MYTATVPNASAEMHRKAYTVVAVGWFVLLVLSDGLLTSLQSSLSLNVPVELIGRAVIIVQFVAAILFSRNRAPSLPGYLIAAISISGVATLLPPFLSLPFSDNPPLVLRTFYFMSGISFLILFVPFLAIGISQKFRAPFLLFAAACLAFGSIQVIQQDLLLPEPARVAFGLQFELFSNGKIRAVGFFSSAPRFAEFLAFIALCLFFDIAAGKRAIVLRLSLYIIVIWLLYNTFSRSGYILCATATLAAIVLARRQLLSAGTIEGWLARLFVVTALLILGITEIWSLNIETLEIYDTTSLLARLNRWAMEAADIGAFTPYQLAFGNGEAPLFSRSEVDYFAVDNLLLVLLRYGGLLSVTAFLFLFGAVFAVGLSESRRGGSAMLRPLLAFQVGLFFQSFFVDNHNTIYLTLFSVLALASANRARLQSQ